MKVGSCVLRNVGFRNTHPFLVYDEMDLQQSRDRIHMNQQLDVKRMTELDLLTFHDW
jgi:hypothetical protein